MKRFFAILPALFLVWNIVFVPPAVSAARSLFDDFSGDRIEYRKWNGVDYVKEIHVSDGKLHAVFNGYTDARGYDYQNMPFVNPDSVYAMKASVAINQIQKDDPGLQVNAQLGGHFYSDSYGDVWVAVSLGDRGNGLEAWWNIHSNGAGVGLAGGTLKQNLQIGTPYEVSLAYDDAQNLFTFSVDGSSAVSSGINRQGPPAFKWKTLDVGACCVPFAGPAYVSASIDDVYINNQTVLYDDFSGSTMDVTKWSMNTSKVIRKVENNRLHLSVQGFDRTTSSKLYTLNQDLRYTEAKVFVNEVSHVSAGGRGKVRLGGEYYNDSRGPGSGLEYNGSLGEVWTEIALVLQDNGELKARAVVSRADDPNWTHETELFNQTFATSIEKETTHVLSIEHIGSKFIFKCNNETISYDILTPMFEPKQKVLDIASRLYLDPGEQGLLDAFFDDIYLSGPNMTPVIGIMLTD